MGFGLSLIYLNNTTTATKFLAPLISFCLLLRWEPIFDCFAPESIAVEIAFEAASTAYLMWVVGPSTQFDSIGVSIWGVALNMVWLFLHLVSKAQTNQYIRVMLAFLPALFAAFMGVFFWTLQTGATCASPYCRRGLGTVAVALLAVQPITSVFNRLYSRIPDDPWEPYMIKMVVSGVSAVTSAYSVWSQHKQGYREKDELWWLFLMSCVGTAVALAEIVLRYIGPLRVSDWVKAWFFSAVGMLCWAFKKLFSGLCSVVKGLFSGLCSVVKGLFSGLCSLGNCCVWMVSY